jgi:hypothetical protein
VFYSKILYYQQRNCRKGKKKLFKKGNKLKRGAVESAAVANNNNKNKKKYNYKSKKIKAGV